MEFYIKKGSTLPQLRFKIVKDGRSDYNRFYNYVSGDTLYFSMFEYQTKIPKVSSRRAKFVKSEVDGEYYAVYQLKNKDTNKVGRYEAQFLLKTDEGTIVFPIEEKLYVNVTDSITAEILGEDSCYTSDNPCCPVPSFTPTNTSTATAFVIELGLDVYYSPGSLYIDYILTSNISVPDDVTVNFTDTIGVYTGSSVVITTGVTISQGNTTGLTEVDLLGVNFDNLNRVTNLSGVSVVTNFTGVIYNLTINNIFPTPTPTITPTVSITPTITPTVSITPTITNTQTTTPTPTPSPACPYIVNINLLPATSGMSDGQIGIFIGGGSGTLITTDGISLTATTNPAVFNNLSAGTYNFYIVDDYCTVPISPIVLSSTSVNFYTESFFTPNITPLGICPGFPLEFAAVPGIPQLEYAILTITRINPVTFAPISSLSCTFGVIPIGGCIISWPPFNPGETGAFTSTITDTSGNSQTSVIIPYFCYLDYVSVIPISSTPDDGSSNGSFSWLPSNSTPPYCGVCSEVPEFVWYVNNVSGVPGYFAITGLTNQTYYMDYSYQASVGVSSCQQQYPIDICSGNNITTNGVIISELYPNYKSMNLNLGDPLIFEFTGATSYYVYSSNQINCYDSTPSFSLTANSLSNQGVSLTATTSVTYNYSVSPGLPNVFWQATLEGGCIIYGSFEIIVTIPETPTPTPTVSMTPTNTETPTPTPTSTLTPTSTSP